MIFYYFACRSVICVVGGRTCYYWDASVESQSFTISRSPSPNIKIIYNSQYLLVHTVLIIAIPFEERSTIGEWPMKFLCPPSHQAENLSASLPLCLVAQANEEWNQFGGLMAHSNQPILIPFLRHSCLRLHFRHH